MPEAFITREGRVIGTAVDSQLVPIQTEYQVHRGLRDEGLIPTQLAELLALNAAAFHTDGLGL